MEQFLHHFVLELEAFFAIWVSFPSFSSIIPGNEIVLPIKSCIA